MMAFDPSEFEREQRERRHEEHRNSPNGQVLALPAPLAFIDHSDIDQDIPMRPFVVDKWVPLGCVTSLYGTGGTGKSFLAMLMGTCISAGIPWLGYHCRQGNVLGLMCEDDDEELRRRRNKIARSLGVKRDQVEGKLFLAPRVGETNALMEFPGGIAIRTPLFHSIMAECRKILPVLLILDNAAQIFAGNENDRAHVTAFLNAIAGIARECNCAVLLLGHPPKNTIATYSGSTGWDAVVRSRMWFKRMNDAEEVEIEGRYTLELLKSNYARRFGIELQENPYGVVEYAGDMEPKKKRGRPSKADKSLAILEDLYATHRRAIHIDEIVKEAVRRGVLIEAEELTVHWRQRRATVRTHLAGFSQIDQRDEDRYALKP